MKSFKEIKKDYRFTEKHEQLLIEMRPLMEENVDEVMKTLNSWMLAHKSTSEFFSEEARRLHVFDSQRAVVPDPLLRHL